MNKNIAKLDWFWRSGSVTPESFSGLVSWWDNGSTYMAADGATWTDRKGGKTLSASAGQRPAYSATLNGKTGYLFDDNNDFFSRARITEIQGVAGLTLFAVGKKITLGNYFNSTTGTYLRHADSFNRMEFYVMAGGTTNWGYIAKAVDYYAVVAVFDGTLSGNAARCKIFINGAQETLVFANTIPALSESNAGSVFYGGGYNAVGLDYFPTELFEQGVYSVALSDANALALSSALKLKYGL